MNQRRPNGELSDEVQRFKYLGYYVEKSELVEPEVKSRVKRGCNVLGALMIVMSCRTWGPEANRRLYEVPSRAQLSQLCYTGRRRAAQ